MTPDDWKPESIKDNLQTSQFKIRSFRTIDSKNFDDKLHLHAV